jgi:peptidoglycan/LPS O-acetylase OafA/YrhL
VTRPLLTNIQLLRFVAAAAVLVGHGGDLFLPDAAAFHAIPWSAGVDVFFVISGFVMTYLTQGQFGQAGAPRAFLMRRFIRIAPPYWLFTTLMVAAVMLFGEHVRNTRLDPAVTATSYLFIPWPRADGQLNPLLSQGWTLNYEAFFYLAFATALFFKRGLWWLAAGFLLLAAAYPFVPDGLFVLKFWANPIILEFLGGIGLGLLFLQGSRLPSWASLALTAAAVTIYLGTGPMEPGLMRRTVHIGLPALLLCASLALAPEPGSVGALRRLLVAGGGSSYTLYLSHTFTLNALLIAWRASGAGMPIVSMILAIIFSIATAALVYRWAERPMTDALHSITGTARARGVAAVAP